MDASFFVGFTSALLAASGAQYVSHKLTNSREKRKDLKTRYEKLYFPVLDDVVSYVHWSTKPYGGNIKVSFRENVDTILENALSHIDKSRVYAEKELLISLAKNQTYKWKDDLSGIHEPVAKLEIIQAFAMETVDLMKSLDILVDPTIVKTEFIISVIVLHEKLFPLEDTPVLWEDDFNNNFSTHNTRYFSKLVRRCPMGYFLKDKFLILEIKHSLHSAKSENTLGMFEKLSARLNSILQQ